VRDAAGFPPGADGGQPPVLERRVAAAVDVRSALDLMEIHPVRGRAARMRTRACRRSIGVGGGFFEAGPAGDSAASQEVGD
jgi:hypothetical protein